MKVSKELILCSAQLPPESGEYRVKNGNPECNSGDGVVYYHKDHGWDLPELIREFYQIIGWYDDQIEQ